MQKLPTPRGIFSSLSLSYAKFATNPSSQVEISNLQTSFMSRLNLYFIRLFTAMYFWALLHETRLVKDSLLPLMSSLQFFLYYGSIPVANCGNWPNFPLQNINLSIFISFSYCTSSKFPDASTNRLVSIKWTIVLELKSLSSCVSTSSPKPNL